MGERDLKARSFQGLGHLLIGQLYLLVIRTGGGEFFPSVSIGQVPMHSTECLWDSEASVLFTHHLEVREVSKLAPGKSGLLWSAAVGLSLQGPPDHLALLLNRFVCCCCFEARSLYVTQAGLISGTFHLILRAEITGTHPCA